MYGADCALLLGSVPALRDAHGKAGLLFIDGHEDATTMEQSTTGEAANMEIALLLGLTGERAPEPLSSRLPALDRDGIAMLGQRDQLYRREIGVPSIAGGVRLSGADEIHGHAAFETGGCRGWSNAVYDTDLDPDRVVARQVVAFVEAVAPSLTTGQSSRATRKPRPSWSRTRLGGCN